MSFKPRLDALPDQQRELWPALSQVPDSFVLYGGTAIALRLGHRASVDFDFFSSRSIDFDALFQLSFVAGAEVLQREPDTLTVSVQPGTSANPVKVSFFGGIDTGRVTDPEQTDDGVVWVASLLDLFATKLKVLLQRVAARDYLDIAAILRAGVPLKGGLGAAAALYGRQLPPTEAVKALAYFDEGDAADVDGATRAFLSREAAAWDFTVPKIAKVAETLRSHPRGKSRFPNRFAID